MEFGVNLNNREPLITSDYTLADLLDLAELAEQRGFGSVWVGDSLFSKPRYEPISLPSAISQRTSRARRGLRQVHRVVPGHDEHRRLGRAGRSGCGGGYEN
jgi:hypothetical protein